MTTRSNWLSIPASDLDQHAGGFLDRLFDALEEAHRLAPVHDTMIVGERDVHHRPRDDGALDHDGAIDDAVQAEDAALRGVDDRRREQRTVDAAVRDGERTTLQLVELQ